MRNIIGGRRAQGKAGTQAKKRVLAKRATGANGSKTATNRTFFWYSNAQRVEVPSGYLPCRQQPHVRVDHSADTT